MLVLGSPTLDRQLNLVARTIPQLAGAAIAVLVHLIISTFFALLLFSGEQRAAVFPTFGEGFYNLLILLTTSNYPDVMMPAYNGDRITFLFFLAFLLIGFFFLMNLFLAVVCKGHSEQREAEAAPPGYARWPRRVAVPLHRPPRGRQGQHRSCSQHALRGRGQKEAAVPEL